jgi:hypothetical protein
VGSSSGLTHSAERDGTGHGDEGARVRSATLSAESPGAFGRCSAYGMHDPGQDRQRR